MKRINYLKYKVGFNCNEGTKLFKVQNSVCS